MKTLERRIQKIEDKLYGRKDYAGGMWVYSYDEDYPPPEAPEDVPDKEGWTRQLMESLGPREEWLTVKSQVEADEQAYEERCKHHPPDIIHFVEIKVDPCAELEARQKATKPNESGENRGRR